MASAQGPLRGTVHVPGDKSISHRVALLAPLAADTCRARRWLQAADTRCSLEAVRNLGADVALADGELSITAGRFPGLARVPAAAEVERSGGDLLLDCGNSGTLARLLLGLMAPWRVSAVLTGDESLRSRPMGRVLWPLRDLGADIQCLAAEDRLPVRIAGRPLRGGECALGVPSAQVKSALLLAGLGADGRVTVRNCGPSRDHTERLLARMGVRLESSAAAGGSVTVWPPASGAVRSRSRPAGGLRPFDLDVPADPSSAAPFWAAALLVSGSVVSTPAVGLNPRRNGFLRALQRMGAVISIDGQPLRDHTSVGPATRSVAAAVMPEGAEPVGNVTVWHTPLRACTITAPDVPAMIDELPLLAVLASQAPGVTEIGGAAELRIKECDRIEATAVGLSRLGVAIRSSADGWCIRGPCRLRATGGGPVILATRSDHRMAMALAVAGLAAEGETALDDVRCVNVSFPDFFATLESLRAGAAVDEG